MKIALIDNMNNNFFALCRYLRDAGVDAHLFCMPQTPAQFLPRADMPVPGDEPDYVHRFPVDAKGPRFIFSTRADLADLEAYDILMGCGYSLGFLCRHGIRTDIFATYGADIRDMPFFRFSIRRPWESFGEAILARYQRKAIRRARVIVTNGRNTHNAGALERLGRGYLSVGLPMVYNRVEYPDHEGTWTCLDDHDFVLFNQGRQLWKSNVYGLPDFKEHGGFKRNDKVIRAFARFVKDTAFQRPLLVLYAYGPDVDASRRLVDELGVSAQVMWMPRTDRRVILAGLARCSLVADQFREGISGIGGTSCEALAFGVPLVTHTRGALEDPAHFAYRAPIMDALTEDDILAVLHDYEKRPADYAQRGRESRAWFDANLGEGLAAKYVLMMQQLAENPDQGQESLELEKLFFAERAGPEAA